MVRAGASYQWPGIKITAPFQIKVSSIQSPSPPGRAVTFAGRQPHSAPLMIQSLSVSLSLRVRVPRASVADMVIRVIDAGHWVPQFKLARCQCGSLRPRRAGGRLSIRNLRPAGRSGRRGHVSTLSRASVALTVLVPAPRQCRGRSGRPGPSCHSSSRLKLFGAPAPAPPALRTMWQAGLGSEQWQAGPEQRERRGRDSLPRRRSSKSHFKFFGKPQTDSDSKRQPEPESRRFTFNRDFQEVTKAGCVAAQAS